MSTAIFAEESCRKLKNLGSNTLQFPVLRLDFFLSGHMNLGESMCEVLQLPSCLFKVRVVVIVVVILVVNACCGILSSKSWNCFDSYLRQLVPFSILLSAICLFLAGYLKMLFQVLVATFSNCLYFKHRAYVLRVRAYMTCFEELRPQWKLFIFIYFCNDGIDFYQHFYNSFKLRVR